MNTSSTRSTCKINVMTINLNFNIVCVLISAGGTPSWRPATKQIDQLFLVKSS